MKTKFLLAVIFIIAGLHGVFAQRHNTYFVKNSGNMVKTLDSADFIRVVSEPDSGTVLYNVKEYYKSGKLKMIGKTSEIEILVLEGQNITYYPSGAKKQFGNFKKNRYEGDVYTFYPNGKLYMYVTYPVNDNFAITNFEYNCLIMACNDSTGKALVTDGNGYYISYNDDFKTIHEEGNVKSGLKDGIWKTHNTPVINLVTKDSIINTEEYDNGKFIKGRSFDPDGKEFIYTEKEQVPQYKGGIQAFYAYLGRKIIYPDEARRKNITGKVYIKFIVELDGSINNATILRSPDPELGAEALRVVKLSPKWIPAIQNGRPIRAYFTVPINFTLNGRTNF